MRVVTALMFAVIFFSCSKNKLPDGILEPEKMQAVYWDVLQADIFTKEFIKDTSTNPSTANARLQLSIFQKHGTNREQFYQSYKYYLDHSKLMRDLVDTMLVRQKKMPAVEK